MRVLARSLAVFVPAALAPSLFAQGSVWVVDVDGGATADADQIGDALALASDGDVIVVRSGSYLPFTVDGLSVVITSEAGADVSVGSDVVGGANVIRIRNVPAGETVTLRGIDVDQTWSEPYRALEIESCAGAVRIEDCTFAPQPNSLNLIADTTALEVVRIVDCAAVALTRCQVVAGDGFGIGLGGQTDAGPAVSATASNVAVYACSFEGGRGADSYQTPIDLIVPPSPGGDGFVQNGGVLFVSDSTFIGGDGGDGVTGFGCSGSGDGGAGLRVSPDGTTVVLVSTFTGGVAGIPGAGCSSGSDGPSVVPGATLQALFAPPRGLASNGPVREGQTATLTSSGVENDVVVLLAGTALHQLTLPLSGVLLTAPILIQPLGVVPAGGQLVTQVPIGPFTNPALEGFGLHLQAAHVQVAQGPLGELQLVTTLSSPTALVLLDQAIPTTP